MISFLTFKKIISRIILGFIIIWTISLLLWKIIIEPCIELYEKHGIKGIVVCFIALTIISFISYVLIKIIAWSIDNS